jgi:UDP-2,3-diacylglucosamine pyrophosphatase LpxH
MRKLDILVLSDLHLGTYGSHAEELLSYLRSVEVDTIILNGDIVDIWQFKKRYFPEPHFQVLKEFISKICSGTKVYYLTGNHDDLLRKISPIQIANFQLIDKLVMNIDGKKVWFFHGDVFDSLVNHSKFIAKLGGKGYDLLIRINRVINRMLKAMGKQPYSFSKKVKSSVKKAAKHISDFETTAADLAISNGYKYVVCGHIHEPIIKELNSEGESVIYMNSGDWVESLTSLEYANGEWKIYNHFEEQDLTEEKILQELEAL